VHFREGYRRFHHGFSTIIAMASNRGNLILPSGLFGSRQNRFDFNSAVAAESCVVRIAEKQRQRAPAQGPDALRLPIDARPLPDSSRPSASGLRGIGSNTKNEYCERPRKDQGLKENRRAKREFELAAEQLRAIQKARRAHRLVIRVSLSGLFHK
jgi:hypothetical protein